MHCIRAVMGMGTEGMWDIILHHLLNILRLCLVHYPAVIEHLWSRKLFSSIQLNPSSRYQNSAIMSHCSVCFCVSNYIFCRYRWQPRRKHDCLWQIYSRCGIIFCLRVSSFDSVGPPLLSCWSKVTETGLIVIYTTMHQHFVCLGSI